MFSLVSGTKSFKSYPVFRDKVVAGDVGRDLGVGGDDLLGPLEGSAKLVMAKMATKPAVFVVTVAQETQVMDLHYPFLCLIICILFHQPADFLANLA